VYGLDALKNYGGLTASMVNIINTVGSLAKNAKVVYEVSIVRGQGYYTGTVFEIYAEGFRGAVSGGGRYDNMVESMVGIKQPAVGLSIGFEPITILARELGLSVTANKKIAILYDEGADFLKVLEEKKEFVKNGFDAAVYKAPKNVKALLEKLKNCGVMQYKFFEKDEIKNIG
jgi:histidyl-tRNA synthetase